MKIGLSEHFTFSKLLRFVLPSIVMMIFTSIYGVVDGLFVSNYAGKTAFAAVNFIMPFLMMLGSIGFMVGTGGSAIVAKTLGEGQKKKASQYFSLFVYITLAVGVFLSITGIIFIENIASLLGAEGELLENCVLYGRIILLTLPAFMLQNVFQSFFVTAEKPHFGLLFTIGAGVANMILDYIFVAVLGFGIVGAAVATCTAEIIGGFLPLLYFLSKNTSLLRLGKTKFYGAMLLRACLNGSSEFLTNISMSLVNMIYNIQLMKYAGENGVAAYGVVMYVNFIFVSIFIGYSIGSAPIVGFHYGAGNHTELKNLLKKSLILVAVFACVLSIISKLLAAPLANIFVGYDTALYELTVTAFTIYSMSYFLMGFNIYASSFFTALNNGIVSGVISFLRTLVFQLIVVLLLPLLLGIDGIWMSVVIAELLAFVVSVIFLVVMKKRYHY